MWQLTLLGLCGEATAKGPQSLRAQNNSMLLLSLAKRIKLE